MENIKYKKLYELQDKVLDLVFNTEKEFYLTGGTCISRFYSGARYSDDLDFFTNNSPRYSFAVKNIKEALKKNFNLDIKVETKNFNRFTVNNALQIDFVNDTSTRYKEVVITEKGYLIDNIENILSNKLTAVIGRDNPKDIFDIYLISENYSFSWQEILKSAHNKAVFKDEELIIRLKSFPKELLKQIKLIDNSFLVNFRRDFDDIIKNISSAIY